MSWGLGGTWRYCEFACLYLFFTLIQPDYFGKLFEIRSKPHWQSFYRVHNLLFFDLINEQEEYARYQMNQ
jgi:hypothetical protein